jgi:hypothetical protein
MRFRCVVYAHGVGPWARQPLVKTVFSPVCIKMPASDGEASLPESPTSGRLESRVVAHAGRDGVRGGRR